MAYTPRFWGDPGRVAGRMYYGAASRQGSPDGFEDVLKSYNGGTRPAITAWRDYSTTDDLSINAGTITSAGQCPTRGAIPIITVKWGAFTAASILAGSHNTDIDGLADQIHGLTNGAWLAPHHEPEDNFTTTQGKIDYITVFRYIVNRIKTRYANQGWTKNYAIAMVYMAWTFASGTKDYTDWYPGDDVVDLIGLDGYNHYSDVPGSDSTQDWVDGSKIFGAGANAAALRGKPWFVGEIGYRTATDQTHLDSHIKAGSTPRGTRTLTQFTRDWWSDFLTYAKNNGCVAVCYFDSGVGGDATANGVWDLTRTGKSGSDSIESNSPRATQWVTNRNSPVSGSSVANLTTVLGETTGGADATFTTTKAIATAKGTSATLVGSVSGAGHIVAGTARAYTRNTTAEMRWNELGAWAGDYTTHMGALAMVMLGDVLQSIQPGDPGYEALSGAGLPEETQIDIQAMTEPTGTTGTAGAHDATADGHIVRYIRREWDPFAGWTLTLGLVPEYRTGIDAGDKGASP